MLYPCIGKYDHTTAQVIAGNGKLWSDIKQHMLTAQLITSKGD